MEEYITSGILEEFVLGHLTKTERAEVLILAERHENIRDEITKIEKSIEELAQRAAIQPPVNLRAKIMKSLLPPALHSKSKVSDYTYWLEKVKKPADFDSMHMEIISETTEMTMVIAWIKEGEVNHTHETYSEIFLIVDGACSAIINGEEATYGPGDYVEFPIHKEHSYVVTSEIPMKVVACLLY